MLRCQSNAADSTIEILQMSTVTMVKIKNVLILLISSLLVIGLSFWLFLYWCTTMPGTPYEGELPAKNTIELQKRLERDVLSLTQLRRNYSKPDEYESSVAFIEARLAGLGLESTRQAVPTERGDAFNVIAMIPGTAKTKDTLVIGAHYDTYASTPGADDNASGVAGALELARVFKDKPAAKNLLFVFYANEEPPYFQTEGMGSLVHAKSLANDPNIKAIGMFSLEMLGYYDTAPNTQNYPPPLDSFYPDRGDFIAFVGSMSFRDIVTFSTGVFRDSVDFPAYGFAGPGFIRAIGFSDQWSYWQVGIPALMVTDTAFFRNDNYHTSGDTPDTLDWDRFARVVEGLEPVIRAFDER